MNTEKCLNKEWLVKSTTCHVNYQELWSKIFRVYYTRNICKIGEVSRAWFGICSASLGLDLICLDRFE